MRRTRVQLLRAELEAAVRSVRFAEHCAARAAHRIDSLRDQANALVSNDLPEHMLAALHADIAVARRAAWDAYSNLPSYTLRKLADFMGCKP